VVEIAPPEVVDNEGDVFQVVMAILIALVTIVGAVIAWRTAALGERAGSADFASTQAVINTEETQIVATERLYQRYRAYTDYALNSELQFLLEDELTTADENYAALLELQLLQANDRLINSLIFFDTRYLDLDGYYDIERDLGEAIADARREKDLNPAPHIASADRSRTQISNMVSIFIVLSVSLLFYTIAEAIHPARRALRYSAAVIATVCLAYSVVAAYFVEFGGGA